MKISEKVIVLKRLTSLKKDLSSRFLSISIIQNIIKTEIIIGINYVKRINYILIDF